MGAVLYYSKRTISAPLTGYAVTKKTHMPSCITRHETTGLAPRTAVEDGALALSLHASTAPNAGKIVIFRVVCRSI